MKYKLKALMIILGIIIAMPVMGWADVGSNYIEQNGISWTFDKNLSTGGAGDTYQYGQFVNGDYWIVGQAIIIQIDPPCIEQDGRVINGAMINPVPGVYQGYDSAGHAYDPDLNVAKNGYPINILVNDGIPIKSLVPTISKSSPPAKVDNPIVQGASVLTIVKNAPANDAFRPPYCGDTKPAEILKSDIIWETLATLDPVQGTPSLETSERNFQRVWLDHKQI